jgi:hypothetical protein
MASPKVNEALPVEMAALAKKLGLVADGFLPIVREEGLWVTNKRTGNSYPTNQVLAFKSTYGKVAKGPRNIRNLALHMTAHPDDPVVIREGCIWIRNTCTSVIIDSANGASEEYVKDQLIEAGFIPVTGSDVNAELGYFTFMKIV